MAFEERIIQSGLSGVAAAGIPVSGVRKLKIVKDIVDASVPPPTTANGDRYILDTSSLSVDASWGSVSVGDIVEYNGGIWKAVTPEEGLTIYVDAKDTDYVFVDDGSPQWVPLNIYDGGFY